MKDILNIIFLIVATIAPSGTVFAYGYGDLGSWSNPLQIQIQPDPLYEVEKLHEVVDTPVQNITGCSVTYDAIKTFKSEIWRKDTSNPSTARDLSNYLKYLYSMHNLCVSRSQQDTQKLEQNCKNDLGAYGKLRSVDLTNRKYACECQSGYTLNSTATSCVATDATPSRSFLDAVCQKNYGTASLYTEESYAGNTGLPTFGCGCKNGYSWNSTVTACVIPPIVPVKTNDQECQEWVKNTKWDGTKNDEGGLICDCKTGYQWNDGQTACVVVPKKEAPKVISSDGGAQSNTVTDTPHYTKEEQRFIDDWNKKNVTANSEEEIKPRGAFSRFIGWLFHSSSR